MVHLPFGLSFRPSNNSNGSASPQSSNSELLLRIQVAAQPSSHVMSRQESGLDLRSVSLDIGHISNLIRADLESNQDIQGDLQISMNMAQDQLTARFSVLETSRRSLLCIPRARLRNATAHMNLSDVLGYRPVAEILEVWETEALSQALQQLSQRRAQRVVAAFDRPASISDSSSESDFCLTDIDSSDDSGECASEAVLDTAPGELSSAFRDLMARSPFFSPIHHAPASNSEVSTLCAVNGSNQDGESWNGIELDNVFGPAALAGEQDQQPLVTDVGRELLDITAALQQEPQQNLMIEYQDQPGIDQGGLQRQALSNALQQLTDQDYGVLKKDGSLLVTTEGLIDYAQRLKLNNLGLVLGAIPRHDFVVGEGLSAQLADQLAPIISYYAKQGGEVSRFPEQLMSSLTGENPTKQKILDALFLLQPHLADGASGEYLRGDACGPADVMNYLTELEPLLMLASGFVATMPTPWSGRDITSAMLTDAINGKADMRHELSQIRIEPRSGVTQEEVNLFSSWFSKAVKDVSDERLRAFCKNITGSPGLSVGQGAQVALLIHSGQGMEDVIASTHTCFNNMDVNYRQFSRALKAGNTEGLLESFFSDTNQFDTD